MKIKLLALCALLSVADANAQQKKYMLPIGSNVNNRPAKVSMSIGDNDISDWGVFEAFNYTPAMGDLTTVVRSRFQVLVKKFTLAPNSEEDEYGLGITVDPGPGMYARFHLRNGAIPPEVLEVKLHYGAAVVWYLKGINKITMQVTDASGTTSFSSQDGSGYETPCGLGVTRELLAEGQALVEREYALPKFQKERGITAGSVTLWQNERYVSFDLLDGHFLGASASPPDFLELLRAPALPAPRIVSIKRSGNTTEITVSAEATSVAYLEFAKTLSGNWNALPAYQVPLTLQTGSTKFTHTTDALASFYRLRVISSSPQ